MATIKSYTDLEQSKKLVEILPIESADMFYNEEPDEPYPKDIVDSKYPMVIREGQKCCLEEYGIPCWSLAALLEVLPDYTLQDNPNGTVFVVSEKEKPIMSDDYDNPVDACYEMIIRLNELKML